MKFKVGDKVRVSDKAYAAQGQYGVITNDICLYVRSEYYPTPLTPHIWINEKYWHLSKVAEEQLEFKF